MGTSLACADGDIPSEILQALLLAGSLQVQVSVYISFPKGTTAELRLGPQNPVPGQGTDSLQVCAVAGRGRLELHQLVWWPLCGGRSHCADVPPPCAGDQGGCGVGGVWRRLGRGEGWHSGPSCSQVPLRSEDRSCHPLSTSSSVRGCGAPLPPLMATWWWGTLCVPLGWNGRRHRMTGIMQRDRGLLCLPSSGPGGLWGPLCNKPPQNIVAEEQRP